MYSNIPQELKSLNQWCCFKIVKRDGKKTKLPVNANTGAMAKSNDETTWASFETAVDAVSNLGCDGIGFFFKYPYVGVDLDNIREDIEQYYYGEREGNIVCEFIEGLKSYTEISISGNGIHIICKGKLPDGQRRHKNIEMYDENRFFVMTGKALGNYKEINSEPYTLDLNPLKQLHDKYIQNNFKTANRQNNDVVDTFGNDLSVQEIIKAASKSENSTRFNVFMNGGWEQFYNSQSEADMAFANDLAFWTARDFTKMDAIFRDSAMFREKYERKTGSSTYGEILLNKAINECMNVFTPQCINDDGYYFIIDGEDTKEVKRKFYGWDDTGNAERFYDTHNGVLKYSFEAKKWFYYNGKIWKKDFEGVAERAVDEVIKNMSEEKLYVPDGIEKDDVIEAFQKHIKRTRNANGRENMLKVARKIKPVLYSDFDGDTNSINLKNGWFDIEKGTLNEHQKEKMFTKMANVEYKNGTLCPRWKKFLEEIFLGDKELIKFVQKAVGYSLTTDISEQVIFVLKGDGSNGKSVFLKIISSIFGDYAKNIQPEALMSNKFNTGTATQQIAMLENVRLAITQESEQGTFFNESLIKQMTGDDTITIKRLYEDAREMTVTFKLWLATNYMPFIRGTDNGIWRRLVIIPFDYTIDREKADKNLIHKLLEEKSGIFEWIIEGYQMWMLEGLNIPERLKMEVEEHKDEMDLLGKFIDDCCELTGTIKSSDLYGVYKQWANVYNEHLYSQTMFGREISKKFERIKGKKANIYKGISLKKELPFFYSTFY